MSRVFEFTQYKQYLRSSFETLAKTRKGVRSRFAEALKCRSGYVTQVLNGDAHLSLEQACFANEFLGHSEDEASFFLLLVTYARAGTQELRKAMKRQIDKAREHQLNMKNRFSVERQMSEQEQAVIYGSWHFLAILTLLTVPGYQVKERIAEKLTLPARKVSEALRFLEEAGFVTSKAGMYVPGVKRTHLPKDSPLITTHHLNWRLKGLQAIENPLDQNLHYSSVVSLSEADSAIVKNRMIQAIEEIAGVIGPSKEEKVYSLCMDFFEI